MKHILIVDDEAPIRQLLAQWFSGKGYRVTEAETAVEARKAAQASPPDLIICDLQLTDSDGLTLLAELRQIAPGVPTILLTGVLFDAKVAAATLDKLVNLYLPKTTKLARIGQEIERLLAAGAVKG